ncbi:unnamed protein product [Malus baccata var. baccata]
MMELVVVFIVTLISIPTSLSVPFIVLHEFISSLTIIYYCILTLFLHSNASFIMIGIGDQCSNKEVKQFTEKLSNFSSTEGYCIIVCDKVVKFSCYHIMLGNLIGRGVVKNFISLGGPHAGTASVPLCGSGIFCIIVNKLLKSEIYTDYIQEHLAPSGYLKLPNFLPKLNNELPGEKNSTYKERFSSLQNLVLIMFEHDTVLIPKETAWFGYYEDDSFKSILSLQQTDLFTEDWIGLRNLDEAGRVKYISVAGGHLGISTRDMKKHAVPYLQVPASMMDGNKKASYTRASGVEHGFVESNEKMQVTPDFDDRASTGDVPEGWSSYGWPLPVKNCSVNFWGSHRTSQTTKSRITLGFVGGDDLFVQ